MLNLPGYKLHSLNLYESRHYVKLRMVLLVERTTLLCSGYYCTQSSYGIYKMDVRRDILCVIKRKFCHFERS